MVESSVNPFSVFDRMYELFRLSFANIVFPFSLCVLVMTGDYQKVSIVTLLTSKFMLHFSRFRLCHDFTDYFSKLFVGKW